MFSIFFLLNSKNSKREAFISPIKYEHKKKNAFYLLNIKIQNDFVTFLIPKFKFFVFFSPWDFPCYPINLINTHVHQFQEGEDIEAKRKYPRLSLVLFVICPLLLLYLPPHYSIQEFHLFSYTTAIGSNSLTTIITKRYPPNQPNRGGPLPESFERATVEHLPRQARVDTSLKITPTTTGHPCPRHSKRQSFELRWPNYNAAPTD